ncbi:MAG: pyruvoyl-dependent arginine decarboxylase [Candidatus Micrarchaeota archaeon]
MEIKTIGIFLLIVLLVAAAFVALQLPTQHEFSTRIPTAYVVTTGIGESDEGIPPDPYETFSYDLALQNASIEDFNVAYYTSVLPPESYEVPLEKAKGYFHHGAVLESIMAKAGGVKGDTVVAGVGRVWAVDQNGKYVGGFAAEYQYVYPQQKVSAETAKEDATRQLTRSMNHELKIRNLKQTGEMKFDIASIYIEKNYGMALAQIGFLDYIYPKKIFP